MPCRQSDYERFINYITSKTSREEDANTLKLEEQLQANGRLFGFLPSKLFPSRKTFEDVGFHLVDTTDPLVYKATLPKGWHLEPAPLPFYTNILDQNGYKRGFYVCKWTGDHRNGYTILHSRFYIGFMPLGNDPRFDLTRVFIQDMCNKVDYCAGDCLAFTDSFTELTHEAEEFLYEKYPDWKNPNKYWDE